MTPRRKIGKTRGVKSRDILLIFDFPEPLEEFAIAELPRGVEWKVERDVVRALTELGHRVRLLGLCNRMTPLCEILEKTPPDVVFNLCESFQDERALEANVAAILEAGEVPFTGESAEALWLSKDKATTKTLVSASGVTVPKFQVLHRDGSDKLQEMAFPVLIKPLRLEASEGISLNSLARTPAEAKERAQFLHRRWRVDVIVEQYIEGREIYVGALGSNPATILSPRELFFGSRSKKMARFATYQTKWNDEYRRRWKIRTGEAKKLKPDTIAKLEVAAQNALVALRLQHCARLDFRLGADGEPYFLEANPNPSMARADDLAQAAKFDGISYLALIQMLVEDALSSDRHRLRLAA